MSDKAPDITTGDKAPGYDWRYDTGEESPAQKAKRLAKMLGQEKRQEERRKRLRQGNELAQLKRRKVRHVSPFHLPSNSPAQMVNPQKSNAENPFETASSPPSSQTSKTQVQKSSASTAGAPMPAQQFYFTPREKTTQSKMVIGNHSSAHSRGATETGGPAATTCIGESISQSMTAAVSLKSLKAPVSALKQAAPKQHHKKVAPKIPAEKASQSTPTQSLKQAPKLFSVMGESRRLSQMKLPAEDKAVSQVDQSCEPHPESDQDEHDQPKIDFVCTLCPSVFRSDEALQLHLDSGHNKTQWLESAYKKATNGKKYTIIQPASVSFQVPTEAAVSRHQPPLATPSKQPKAQRKKAMSMGVMEQGQTVLKFASVEEKEQPRSSHGPHRPTGVSAQASSDSLQAQWWK